MWARKKRVKLPPQGRLTDDAGDPVDGSCAYTLSGGFWGSVPEPVCDLYLPIIQGQ